MAAATTAIPCTEIWQRFRCLAEQRIGEGNLEAGERLWEVVHSPLATTALTIRSTRWTADAIECVLDVEAGALTCAPGEALAAAPWNFQVVPHSRGMVRRGGVDFTIDQAVNVILDELVWLDAGGEESQ